MRKLKFEIAPILEARFVRKIAVEKGVELGDAPGVADVVVAEAGDAERHAGLRLDSRWRNPAHAIHFKRRVILGVDDPIDLREENRLLALARHFSQLTSQTV